MLVLLYRYLNPLWSASDSFVVFRTAYAAVTALVLMFLLTPLFVRWMKHRALVQVIREEGPNSHFVKSETPTAGGALILFVSLVVLVLYLDLSSLYSWLCMLTLVLFGAVGFFDDYYKLKKKHSDGVKAFPKFLLQSLVALVIALIVYFWGDFEFQTFLYLPFFKGPLLDLSWLYIPLVVLIFLSMTNAFNLTDGLDGLAIGLFIIVMGTLGLIAYGTGRADFAPYLNLPYIQGMSELAVVSLALVGTGLGFLWFNAHPASLMMGDVGSLSLGAIIALFSLLLKKEFHLPLLAGIFVLETLSVIVQVWSFKTRGRRVFKMAPLHHHYELLGWQESKIVIRFWILGLLFAVLTLITFRFPYA